MASRVIGGPAQVRPQMIQQGDIAQPDDGLGQAANFVMKLGERYAQGQLAQKQQQMFVQGMQRVATGEALSDIKKDQPEFASLFGDTASIQGAQAMAKVKAVDDFTTKAYEQMPELAKMDPQKASKVLTQGMSQHLTGDVAVDSVIQARMVEQLPVLMKAQTKANYAYVQGESARQYSGLLASAGKTMQTAAVQLARGAISQQDFDVARSNAVSVLQKPAGQSDETYRKTIYETAQLQLSEGNHWFDRTLRQRGPNGEPSFYETVLDPDQQKKLNEYRLTAERNTAKQYGFNQYGSVIAELGGRAAGMSPADIQKNVLRINEQYMRETGAESGIIDMADAMAMTKSSYTRSYALADKAAELRLSQSLKDQSDLAKTNATLQKAITMAMLGQGEFAVAAGVKKDEFDQVVWEGFNQIGQQKGMEDATKMLVNNWQTGGSYVNPHVQNELQAPFRQGESGAPTGESMAKAVTIYSAMLKQKGGQAAADAYLGPENTVKMENYLAAINSGQSTSDATVFAMGKPLLKGQRFDTEEGQPIIDKVLSDEYKAGGANGWFQTPMYGTSKQLIQTIVGPAASTLMANRGLPPEAAVKRALPMVRDRFDILGPLAVSKRPDQESLAQALATSREDAGKIAFETIQQQARKQGVNIDIAGMWDRKGGTSDSNAVTGRFGTWDALFGSGEVSAIRMPDQVRPDGSKLQMYHATVTLKDGSSADFYFDSDQMKQTIQDRLAPKPKGGRLNPSVPDDRVK